MSVIPVLNKEETEAAVRNQKSYLDGDPNSWK
jgi:hypothetical protein